MMFTADTHVADIAAALPSSVRVFQKYGIDFCCGGKKPLAAVCSEHRLAYEEVAQAIVDASTRPAADDRDWTREPLGLLIDHIVTTYHDRLRTELPRLGQMASRVLNAHGAKEPALLGRIDTIVGELAADLSLHMQKEELILFPAILSIERNEASANSAQIFMPIRVMEQEHDHAGDLLSELRAITRDYALPDWACSTYRALYQGLEELEREMHVHVHLENNVLFPRALDFAGGGGTEAA